MTAVEVKAWTDRDPVLSRVRNMVLNGWRSKVNNDAAFLPYKQRELSLQDGLYCGDIVWSYSLSGGRL